MHFQSILNLDEPPVQWFEYAARESILSCDLNDSETDENYFESEKLRFSIKKFPEISSMSSHYVWT